MPAEFEIIASLSVPFVAVLILYRLERWRQNQLRKSRLTENLRTYLESLGGSR